MSLSGLFNSAINMRFHRSYSYVTSRRFASLRSAFSRLRWRNVPWLRNFLLLLAGIGVGCQSQPQQTDPRGAQEASAQVVDRKEEEIALRQLLSDQQAAWNQGDLEGFMAGYAKTDTLRFASGGSVRTGWQETLNNYKRGYPDRAAMGKLIFDEVDVEVMTNEWAMIFGRWTLDRENDRPSGLFTLIAHRNGPSPEWKIVHDHTSSDPAEETESD